MARFSTCILLVMASLAQATYDCRRPNSQCQNGGTCSFASSACNCPDAYGGDDCGLEKSTNGTGDCTSFDPCIAGQGWCYDGGAGNPLCYCENEYYKDDCGKARFDLLCGDMNMVIVVNPYVSTFDGTAYLDGKLGTLECQLTPVASGSRADNQGLEGFDVEVNHDSPECGPAEEIILPDGTTKYTRIVVVKYNTDFLTSLDDRFTASCTVQNGTSISSEVQLNLKSTKKLNEIKKEKTLGDVTLAIARNGNSISDSELVDIGDELTFVIGVGGGYNSMVIEKIEATGPLRNTSLMIMDGNCMRDEAAVVILQPLTPDPDPKANTSLLFITKLRAFVFDNDTRVIFTFTYKLCVEANGDDCIFVNCTDGTTAYGRRKRDSPDVGSVTGEVYIRYPGYTPEDDVDNVIPPVRDCTRKDITAILIALCASILFLFVTSVVLLACVIFARRRRTDKSESKSDLYGESNKSGLNTFAVWSSERKEKH